jgi:hypothetical protein
MLGGDMVINRPKIVWILEDLSFCRFVRDDVMRECILVEALMIMKVHALNGFEVRFEHREIGSEVTGSAKVASQVATDKQAGLHHLRAIRA